jgi:hypothetical protein
VELVDGAGALPLLKLTHVGGASLSKGQDAIAQVDVVEPWAAEDGVQVLVGLLGSGGMSTSEQTIEAPTAPLRTAQQANSQGKTNSP